MSSQSSDVHGRKIKLTSAEGRSPSCVQQNFYLHRHQGVLEDDTSYTLTSK